MNTQPGSSPNPEEEFDNLDEGAEEEAEGEPCPFCQGEGMIYHQDEYDEEDRDFVQCKECNGSGIDPESLVDNTEDL